MRADGGTRQSMDRPLRARCVAVAGAGADPAKYGEPDPARQPG